MKKADYLIRNGCVITMNQHRDIIRQGYVALQGDSILSVGGTGDGPDRFEAAEIIDAGGRIIIPGLINTHTHLFQTLLKGLGKDRPLLEWLDLAVRPALRRYDEDSMYCAAAVGLIEAVRSGTTTVLDYQYNHAVPGLDAPVLKAFEDIGVRGVFGKARCDVSGFPESIRCSYVETEDDFFREAEELCVVYADHPTIDIALAPGIIWDLSDTGFHRTREVANRFSVPITMHLAETEDDEEYARERFGRGIIDFLVHHGILGNDFLAVHCCHLQKQDIGLFSDLEVKVSHCPASNMLLASGTAPIPLMLEQGVSVGLGTDGAASNDSQDIMEAIKLTALLHKLVSRDASAVPALQALEMATIGGAAALGKGGSIGSLEQGKKADLVILNPGHALTVPRSDPVSGIVYAAGQQNVESVFIGGRPVLHKGTFQTVDEAALLQQALHKRSLIIKEAGLGAPR